MLRKVILSLALTLCTAGGALAQTKEKMIFPLFMRDCVVWNIPKLDDRTSPAETIADAAIHDCWATGGDRALGIYGIDKGFSPEEAATYWIEIRKVLRERAIFAVLKHRTKS